MDELAITTAALRAFAEATEKAEDGLEDAIEAMDESTGAIEKSTAAIEKSTDVIDTLRKSCDEIAQGLKSAAEAVALFIESLDVGHRSLSEILDQWRDSPLDRLKAAVDLSRAEDDVKFVSQEQDIAAAKYDKGSLKYDMVFFDLEKESELAREREKLIDQRIEAELRLANAQKRNAKTHEEREKAQTRVEQAEHQKRLNNLRKAAAEEKKTHEMKLQVVARVGDGTKELGNAIYDGIMKVREGEKGAVAEMLADFLKGVAKKHAVLALAEAAMALTSLAMFNFPGAAAHGAAAGMHAGVAAAAGFGASAASAVAEMRGAGGSGGTGDGPATSARSATGARSMGPGNGGGGGSEGLEEQDVPVSHEQLRRNSASARPGAGAQITINNPQIYGAGGVKEFAAMLRTELDRQDRGGRKPRL